MEKFTVTYHTSGGLFRQEVEADSREDAMEAAEKRLKSGSVRYERDDVLFNIDAGKVAAVSVAPSEDRNGPIGLRGRR